MVQRYHRIIENVNSDVVIVLLSTKLLKSISKYFTFCNSRLPKEIFNNLSTGMVAFRRFSFKIPKHYDSVLT